jgi:transcription elongation factor GreB
MEQTISIVGRDEIDTEKNYVSWMSPIARALLKKREGDEVRLQTPKGVEVIEIVEVVYKELD